MFSNLLVSVIMPAYNAERFILDSIVSVLSQSHTNFELIIVDDCSSDKTYDLAFSMSKTDSRIRVFRNAINLGSAASRNFAINLSQGRFVAFLDADDLWFNNKLSVALDFMLANDLPFFYSAYNVIDVDGRFIRSIGVPHTIKYTDLLKTCYIGCLTAVYDKKYFGVTLMPDIRLRQDYGLWLSLLARTKEFRGLNLPLASYRFYSYSLSANKIRASLYTWYLFRDYLNLSFVRRCFYFSNYAIRHLIRNKFPKLALYLNISFKPDD